MKHSSKIKLVSKSYSSDSIGQRVASVTLKDVWCDVKSISGKEFAQSGLIGIKPEFVFCVWQNEYSNEEEIIFEENAYAIYRTYLKDDGRIELYTQKKVGVNE